MVRGVEPQDARPVRKSCEAELVHKSTIDLIRQRAEDLSRDDYYYLVASCCSCLCGGRRRSK